MTTIFREDDQSVFKILTLIRNMVVAHYGRNSLELNQIDTIIRRMRETKLITKPATENTPEEKMSQSEKSYGSVTQSFSDLITVLAQLPGFNPSNPLLQIGQLQNMLAQLNQFNMEAANRCQ